MTKLVVGPIDKGLRNDVEPFNIDNDNFPQLINAYQWRGRIKRKRGTSLLGRLTRQIDTESIGTTGASPWSFNLFTVTSIVPEANASVVPGSLQIFINPANVTGSIVGPKGYTRATDCEVFTTPTGLKTGDQVTISGVNVVPGTGPATINGGPWNNIEVLASSFKIKKDSHSWGKWSSGGTWTKISGAISFQDQGDGTLTSATGGNSGTINYLTGDIVLTHTAGAGIATDATFEYYPNLPVMGLEDLDIPNLEFPGTLGFDTTYSYNISTVSPYDIYDVNFYKNPPLTTAYTNYVPKTTDTAFVWNGQDYQQFWTVNYEGALWATNGITEPFNVTNIGMQYKSITTVDNITGGPPASADLTITAHGLSVGDFIFVNEVDTTTGINFQTGYVTTVVNANKVTVEFPNATIATNGSGGIAQYLTNNADSTRDCIRWYDGDPTTSNYGWVNFAPPLSQRSYSIAGLPAAQYYLAGARMIVPFKDRLLFIGPVVQTSSAASQIYLQDTIISSQNGTPYYTSSFTGDPTLPDTTFHPILVPDNQTANASAYFEDSNGFGVFKQIGVSQQITTASSNEDVIILGLEKLQVRFVYSGNDIDPFNFYMINSELGSSSTFSIVNMDEGVITRGPRGIIITSQTAAKRIDLDIPNEVFKIMNIDNGTERMCSQRDYINEWIYFTYPSDRFDDVYPNTTLQYNYRDNSWAIFYENYTTYGSFRKSTGDTWATIGSTYPTWSVWNEPWDSGASELLAPKVIGGNQQGFVILRNDGTDESPSLYISDITAGVITSPNHCLKNNDYIIITGCLGTIGAQVNNKIFTVTRLTVDTFTVNPGLSTGTYIGGGLITKMYVPFIQSKQFPLAWDLARKTRIGVQQYLLSTTDKSQITLLMFLSQNSDVAYNNSPIIPSPGSINNSLIYSTVLYTCPESTNLGLTPSNINLQSVTALAQQQIWHRINTSLIGDTVQVGFTLSPTQMTSLDSFGVSFSITGASKASFCVLTCTGKFTAGTLITITGVIGMTELNGNTYNVVSSDATTVTIEIDSTGFTTYSSGGTATPVAPLNQFAEIELHGFILDVTPSMVLA